MIFSAEQLAIFDWFKKGTGNLAIIARAGSGKTTTCVKAMEMAPEPTKAYLVFNAKNVVDAKRKFTDPRVKIQSLHGLGFSYVLSKWADAKPDPKLDYERVQKCWSRKIPFEPMGAIVSAMDYIKNTSPVADKDKIQKIVTSNGLLPPKKFGFTAAIAATIIHKAMELSAERDPDGRISFTDMIWLPVRHSWCYPKYQMVVTDEAQDLNAVQCHIVMKALKKGGRQVLIGDPAQCIYSFRGASMGLVERLAEKLGATKLTLTTTYRCPKKVVELAQQYVPDIKAADGAAEGTVEYVLEDKVNLQDIMPGDAILSRVNAPLVPWCLRLLKAGKPVKIQGKDIAQQLIKIMAQMSKSTLPALSKELEEYKNDTLINMEDPVKIETFMDNIGILKEIIAMVGSVGEVETTINKNFADAEDLKTPVVLLSSVHRAKGLEWPQVWLLTSTFKGWETPGVGEEANISYIGITRAQRDLRLIVGAPKAKALPDPYEAELHDLMMEEPNTGEIHSSRTRFLGDPKKIIAL